MEYNTVRPKMLIPEYGRNVQKMIDFARKIEDRDERNRAAKAIIEVMGQLNPHLRDVDDFKHKLWTHLFIMSDFQLDVDSPYPIPSRETLEERPERLGYPKNSIRYGHYGHNIQEMIKKALVISDPEEKSAVTRRLANIMKKLYLTYNNDTVENKVIMNQLSELSNGKLQVEDPEDLTSTNQILRSIGVNPNARKKKPLKGKNKKKR
ncbi:DUF4290 domain-containing protein [Wandonia haliotis]|uniref:DUF4290 domain-containing protein n=1 Tax=Wandonia haliotis TaxID=574963 RepID=A0ABN1MRF6_9FLAO